MSYCGDSSLSDDIQQRVNSKLIQTLDLATSGQKVEALLGCDFILRLDSLFEPARKLQKQIQNNEPIQEDELLALAGLSLSAAESSPVAPLPDTPEPAWTPRAPDDPENEVPEGMYGHAVEPTEVDKVAGGQEDLGASLQQPEPYADGDLYEPETTTPQAPAEPPAPEPPEPVAAAAVTTDDTGDRRSTSTGDAPDRERQENLGPPPSPEARRIEALLGEGEEALFRGETQKAIDTWSRIFLIDVNNAEANERIEKAQVVKAESERQIEEFFSDATVLLNAGEPEAALLGFEKILDLDPNHPGALQQIERLGAPKADDVPEVATTPSHDGDSDPMLAPPLSDLIEDDEVDESPDDFPLPPPPRTLTPNLRFIAIGSAVLVLVVVGAYLINSNWGRLFPNSQDEVVAAPRRPIDRIARIMTLHERGETDQAVAALKQITSDSPDYERAQLLLTEWESPAEAAGVPEEEQVQAWTALIGRAREAYAAGEYLSAASLFNRASAVAPLEGAEAGLFEDSKRQLEPILQMVGLYRQRQYEMALPTLWRYREENPGNQDVRRLLINSYYNLAVRALRQAQPKRAVALAQEAVTLDQDDAYAQRLLLFAQSYDGAPSDLLYDIFINNLEIRP